MKSDYYEFLVYFVLQVNLNVRTARECCNLLACNSVFAKNSCLFSLREIVLCYNINFLSLLILL